MVILLVELTGEYNSNYFISKLFTPLIYIYIYIYINLHFIILNFGIKYNGCLTSIYTYGVTITSRVCGGLFSLFICGKKERKKPKTNEFD